MTTPLGKSFRLQYEDPTTPGSYINLANCRSNSQSIGNETIEVTDKDGAPDRTLIEGGIRSSDVSASGVFTDAASIKLMKQWTRAGSIKNFRTIDGLGNSQTGAFLCATFEHAGEFDGEQTYDVKLMSSGVMTYIDV